LSAAAVSSLLPLPVALALTGAVVAPIGARVNGRLPLITSMLALGAAAGVLLAMAPDVYSSRLLVHFMGHWGPVSGKVLGDAFAADPLGLDFALVIALVGTTLLLFTLSSFGDLGRKELGNFACLFLLLVAALIGSALTADLLNLFVWFEVAALASYALTAFFLEEPLALEAAFKVVVLTNLASFLVFLGTALIYARTGALNFAQIYGAVHSHPQLPDTIALGLLIAGFLTKAGIAPFHGWLPDAHTAAPGPVSALFSGLMVNLGIVAVARVTFQLFTPGAAPGLLGLLMALGLLSAVGGAFFAVLQDDLKRLLAYDTISQMGVLLIGLATGRAEGVAGATYHLINHALFKSLLFLCAGSIVHMTGSSKLSEMGALARRMPGIAVAFVVGAGAIAGLPPLNGYAGLGLIHEALFDSHQYVPLALMLIAQIFTVAALGKATWQAFFRRATSDPGKDEPLRPGMLVALLLLGGACLAFGVLPDLLLPKLAGPAAGGLLAAPAYTRDILAGGGRLPSFRAAFDYFDTAELAAVAATALVAYPVGRLILSRRCAKAMTIIRSVQSGTVNDYASYLVVGLVAVLATLLVAR
jgi:multicomponent Na+:H+ antiporter subunit D